MPREFKPTIDTFELTVVQVIFLYFIMQYSVDLVTVNYLKKEPTWTRYINETEDQFAGFVCRKQCLTVVKLRLKVPIAAI